MEMSHNPVYSSSTSKGINIDSGQEEPEYVECKSEKPEDQEDKGGKPEDEEAVQEDAMEMSPNPVYSSSMKESNNGGDEAEQEESGYVIEDFKEEKPKDQKDKPEDVQEANQKEDHVYEVPSLESS